MQTAAYAMTRLILFGFGWGVATLLALTADMMMAGTKWPVFGIFAAWWTYICALYVVGEAQWNIHPQEPSVAERRPETIGDHFPGPKF